MYENRKYRIVSDAGFIMRLGSVWLLPPTSYYLDIIITVLGELEKMEEQNKLAYLTLSCNNEVVLGGAFKDAVSRNTVC